MARLYEDFLVFEEIEHSSAGFIEFSHTRMDGEVCPVGGELSYVDGTVECSVHGDYGSEDEGDEDNEDEDDDGIPFL